MGNRKDRWDLDHMPSQDGKIAIVTGANSGIGYYTAKGLAMKGANVIMACRNRSKAEAAADMIKREAPDARLSLMDLDLSDLSSVKAFSENIKNSFSKLDLLINNAGVMGIPYTKTVDGFEMQFAVNHLGHFALTGQLYDLLSSTKGSRVVVVCSSSEKTGKIDMENLQGEKRYRSWRIYFNSKLATMLFMLQLARQLEKEGKDMIATAAHPGYSDSGILEKGPQMRGQNWLARISKLPNKLIAQSAPMGALPTLYAATSEDVVNGGYYGPGGFLKMRGYPAPTMPGNKFITEGLMAAMWRRSEELSGVSFLSV